MSDQSKISASHLNLWYGKFQALIDVNVAIAPRRITAIIGSSGCGKSTLLRCFNRMNDLVEGCRVQGSVKLDDCDVHSRDMPPERLRRRVGMVFQRPNPFPLSVFDNVAYGPRVHGTTGRAELEEIVETSLRAIYLWDDLKDRLDRSALELSPEQQQRLCVARLLAVQPEVLLMDEPCSALDPIATGHIEELMLQLCRDYTILIVTHNMQQASRVSHDTAFMLLGELIEFGPTKTLFTNPGDKRTEDYITGRFG